ncbi:MAG: hypothetical protein ACRELV_12820 [Longimicrobiales bacterium]
MKELARYGVAGTVTVGMTASLLTAVLEAGALRAVWVAAVVALPVQVVVFGGLLAGRRRPNEFLAALAGGTLARLGALLALAAWVWWTKAVPAAALLLSAAGFFFMLMLLEPVFYRPKAGVR